MNNTTYPFESIDGDSTVRAQLTIKGHGDVMDLQIDIAGHDVEQGSLSRSISIDCVLDQQFHMLLSGLDPEETDALAQYIFAHSDCDSIRSVSVRRKSETRANAAGISRITTTDIANLPFATILMGLASTEVVPVLDQVVQKLLVNVDHPVWKLACTQPNMFFGSNQHRAKTVQGMEGLEFDCESMQIWIAREGHGHRIIFGNSDLESKLMAGFPANEGGPTLIGDGKQYMLLFDPRMNPKVNLTRTLKMLRDQNIVSAETANRLAAHLLLLGGKKDPAACGLENLLALSQYDGMVPRS